MNNWIYTKEKKWIDKWNDFMLSDESSSFVQSIYRVKAYEKYGMDWELLLCVDESDTIQVGSANVIVTLPFFKLYVCSYGPTMSSNIKTIFDSNEFIKQFINRGKELRAFSSQITIPMDLLVDASFKSIEGRIFTNISNPRYSNLINLKLNEDWLSKEELINSFLPRGRRDVRASCRKGLVSQCPTTEDELKQAYLCFETNAKKKGYHVRSWEDMRDFVIESVQNKTAFVISAWYNDTIQGAIFLERSSNVLSYTMGGVYRNSPDLLTGYFLQLEGMLLARSMDLSFYDISYGGPDEVQRFKSMFNPVLKESYRTVYFKNNNIKFFIFKKVYSSFKSLIPKIISIKRAIIS
ncbi:hypothetical protein [Flavobacterium muglaense]|uniref:Uncharacterized protein n=1 Tax=Flavobacterium muglaense TaxID=2764716 RepID=A0A923MYP1_9FLAO|nr:hypothetical protein [Flavobacterium muglaense]MBC5837041.1 hypothetical protein [Flavobacterium muglaense]MBC5843570.1 hypothetical protein [Flavobacterium muglaense]